MRRNWILCWISTSSSAAVANSSSNSTLAATAVANSAAGANSASAAAVNSTSAAAVNSASAAVVVANSNYVAKISAAVEAAKTSTSVAVGKTVGPPPAEGPPAYSAIC